MSRPESSRSESHSQRREKGDQKREKGEQKREKSDLNEKVLCVNRCSKVVQGGRKFSFSALVLVGDKHGRIGYGFAKANELTDAIRRGGELARKNLKKYHFESSTIPHEISVQCDGVILYMKPTPAGSGVVAGSKVRAILEMLGIKDVMAKNIGGNNPINMVRATFEALDALHTHQEIKQMRGVA